MLSFVLAFQTLSRLDRMVQAIQGHRAVSGVLRSDKDSVRFRILAPDRLWMQGDAIDGTVACDGTQAWVAADSFKIYGKVAPDQALALANPLFGYSLLLTRSPIDPLAALRAALLIDGTPLRFDLVRLRREILSQRAGAGQAVNDFVLPARGSRIPTRMRVDLDPATSLPATLRTESEYDMPDQTYRYENVVFDPPLTDADFRFTPPVGYRSPRDLFRTPVAVPPRKPAIAEPSTQIAPHLGTPPGAWGWTNGLALRVARPVRAYAGRWVFDVERRGPVTWNGASALAAVRDGWRFATLVSKGATHAVVTFPQSESKVPPRALQVVLNSVPSRPGKSAVFLIEWPKP